MTDRDKWLKALNDFGRGPDVGGDYATHIEQTRVMREVVLSSGRPQRVLLLSNDNNGNYSADMFQFPPL